MSSRRACSIGLPVCRGPFSPCQGKWSEEDRQALAFFVFIEKRLIKVCHMMKTGVDCPSFSTQIPTRKTVRRKMCIRDRANPVLLEPICKAEVYIPDEYMGDIIGDMNRRRGRILGMNPQEDGIQQVVAEVPMSEMVKYAPDLR